MTVYYGLDFVGQFFPEDASREDVVAALGELAKVIGEDATGVLRGEAIAALSPTSWTTLDGPRAEEVKAAVRRHGFVSGSSLQYVECYALAWYGMETRTIPFRDGRVVKVWPFTWLRADLDRLEKDDEVAEECRRVHRDLREMLTLAVKYGLPIVIGDHQPTKRRPTKKPASRPSAKKKKKTRRPRDAT